MRLRLCVRVCISVSACRGVRVCVCVCAYVRVCVCWYVSECECVYVHVYVSAGLWVRVNMRARMCPLSILTFHPTITEMLTTSGQRLATNNRRVSQ